MIEKLEPPFLILGDFNAHHSSWGSSKNDQRGTAIATVIEENNVVILNDGSHTFVRGEQTSAIDLSIASADLTQRISWVISADTHGSDHAPIRINLRDTPPLTSRKRKWKHSEANWEDYANLIDAAINPNTTLLPDELAEVIVLAAEHSIPRTSSTTGKRAVHWWNTEVKDAVNARRKALRKLKNTPLEHPLRETRAQIFRDRRNECRSIIRAAKTSSWENFLDGIDCNISTSETWRRVNAMSGKRRQTGLSIKKTRRISNKPAFRSSQRYGRLFPEIVS